MTTTIARLWDGSSTMATAGMTYEDNGSTSHKLIDGSKFKIPAPPPGTSVTEVPAQIVRDAVEAHNALAVTTHSKNSDPNLSTVGRQNALAQPQKLAVFTIANLAAQLKAFRASVDQREARLFALPPLSNSPADAIREWEIRSWFDRQTDDQKVKTLHSALETQEGESLIAAVLRGPMASLNPQIKMVRAAWEQSRRDTNAVEAEAIDAQRAAADWAYEALARMAAMVLQLCRTWGKPDIIAALVSAPTGEAGWEIFGFSPREARTATRIALADAVAT